jgi:hypothetical protein
MNNRYKSFLFGIVLVAVIIIIVLVGSLSSTAATINMNINKAIAFEGGVATNTAALVLHSPIYTEIDKITSQKAVMVNGTAHATQVTFSRHGTAKRVNFTDSGKGLIIPRGINGVISSKGQATMMTRTGDKAYDNGKTSRS